MLAFDVETGIMHTSSLPLPPLPMRGTLGSILGCWAAGESSPAILSLLVRTQTDSLWATTFLSIAPTMKPNTPLLVPGLGGWIPYLFMLL